MILLFLLLSLISIHLSIVAFMEVSLYCNFIRVPSPILEGRSFQEHHSVIAILSKAAHMLG